MPFDGLKPALSAEDALATAFAAAGVGMIAPQLLASHKAKQLQRYEPSRFYRHGAALVLAQCALLLIAAGGFCALSSSGHPWLGSAVGAFALALLLAPLKLRVRGPARWRERRVRTLDGVHPEIRARAQRLTRQIPELDYRVGELIQDEVTLDPYLIAEYRGERAVVGIWDGASLIA